MIALGSKVSECVFGVEKGMEDSVTEQAASRMKPRFLSPGAHCSRVVNDEAKFTRKFQVRLYSHVPFH
jgi:hypothetical protein